jgi:hypothetical protein
VTDENEHWTFLLGFGSVRPLLRAMIRIIQISDDSFITADGGLEFSSHGSNVLRFYRGKHCEVASVPLGSRQHAESEARRLAKWLATGNGDSIFKLSKEETKAETSPVAVERGTPNAQRPTPNVQSAEAVA